MMTVNTLGRFQITDGSVVMGDEGLRSPMLTKLLMYLLLYRDRTLTTEDMIAALWQEEIDNPAGALKNLMYRLRKVLTGYFGNQEFVRTSRGSYQWNPAVEVNLDVEQFDKLLSAAKLEQSAEKKIRLYEQAIDLYQGDFMPGLVELHWLLSQNTYYHSQYLTCVKGLATLYGGQGRYEEVERLMAAALKLESGDEQLYGYQIEAHMHCGKISLAMEAYEKACRILEQQLGIRKTPILNRVYEELLSFGKGGTVYPVSEVKKDIEEEDPSGVFLCGYPIFKKIYHLEVRKSMRSSEPEQLVLFTFLPNPEEPKEVADFRIRQAMNATEETIRECLRAGDAASRYSDTQFILLLWSCTRELAMLVSNRILSHLYDRDEKYKKVKVKIHIEQVSREGSMVD